MTTTTEVRTELVWTPEAWDEFTRIKNHVADIRVHWGSEMGNRAGSSLLGCLTHLMACGPSRISRDGDLSLYIVTPHIHMGMIFHGDTAQQIQSKLGHRAFGIDEIERAFTGAYPAPRPGEWSLHS